MRRTFITLALGAALSLTLVGCSMGKAPEVTPMPNPVATQVPGPTQDPKPTKGMDEPTATNDAHYDAATDGAVEDSTPPAGTVTKNAMDKAGNAVRRGAEDVKRGLDDMMY